MGYFNALKAHKFATEVFTKAGLDFEKLFAAADDNALKAHIDSLTAANKGNAEAEEALRLATEENGSLSAKLTEIEGKLTAAAAHAEPAARYGALSSALTACGVNLSKVDFKADAKAVETATRAAIDARVSTKAREMVATTTGTTPVDETASQEAANGGGKKTMSRADFSKLPAAKQSAFCADVRSGKAILTD